MSIQITEEDLNISLCPKCQGRKRVEKTTQTSTHSSFTEDVDCEACGGRGLKLTSVGAKLFDFVREAGRFGSF